MTIRTEDALLLILGFAWLIRIAVHKDMGLVRDNPLNQPIGFYIAVCIVTTLIGLISGSVNGITGFFFVLKYIEYFVVYFIVINNIHSRSQIRQFTIALLITAFIVSLVAMAQIPTGGRVSAPFEGERGEPNTLGGYIILVGAVAGGLILQLKKAWTKYLLGTLIFFLLIPLAFTGSRASFLALPFVYIIFIVLHKKRRMTMIFLLIAFTVLGAVMMLGVVKERIMFTFTQKDTQQEQVKVGGVKLDTSSTARLISYQNALNGFMDSPLWGYGVTGYGFVDGQYPRILVETGLLGMAMFIFLIYMVFRQALGLFRETGDNLYRALAMALIAGLVGLLIHAMTANTFIIVRIMEPFWLLVGLVVSAARLEAEEVE